MSRVCQCRNGKYSSKCCKDRLAQGIGSLYDQSNEVVNSQNVSRQIDNTSNGTDI